MKTFWKILVRKKILNLYIVNVIVFSTIPLSFLWNPDSNHWPPSYLFNIPIDKLGHFLVYLMLGVLAISANYKAFKHYYFGALFALIMELFHLIIPYREFEYLDLFSNQLGYILPFIIVHLKKRTPFRP